MLKMLDRKKENAKEPQNEIELTYIQLKQLLFSKI